MGWIANGIDDINREQEYKNTLKQQLRDQQINKDMSFIKSMQESKGPFMKSILHDFVNEFGEGQYFETNNSLLDRVYTEMDPYSEYAKNRTMVEFTLLWEVSIYKSSLFKRKSKLDKSLTIKFFIKRHSHEYDREENWRAFDTDITRFEKGCHITYLKYLPVEQKYFSTLPFNCSNDEIKDGLIKTFKHKHDI